MTERLKLSAGLGFSVFGHTREDAERASDIIRDVDVVTLHTAADPTDVTTAEAVRRIKPGVRLWLAVPGNYLVRVPSRQLEAESRRIARTARDAGCEAAEVNGEGSSDPAKPGDWIPSDPAERIRLNARARVVLASMRDEVPGLALSWTSHDMPGFELPWSEITEWVDLFSPQHYPAEKGKLVRYTDIVKRVSKSQGRWEARAEDGQVPPDVVPYGERWVPYGQGWGHSLAASCWLLDQAPISRLWAYPSSWDANGSRALRAMARVRGIVGPEPGAVARWQHQEGLDPDGNVGRATELRMVARHVLEPLRS